MRYGMSYMGSKSKIAKDIINFLPSGKRLVDLFGGGGAISHCALLSNKYEKVCYREINSLICETFKKAMQGFYSHDNFQPKWISAEDFKKNKDVDGYIKICWSFGNDGRSYLFSSENEKLKKPIFESVVSGKLNKETRHILPDFEFKTNTITDRRKEICKEIKKNAKIDVKLQRLQSLQSLESLERLESLEIYCESYKDYVYQDGDIVYCDPPYEKTRSYEKNGFNHKEFYDWVKSRSFPVYFSSYEISDKRFSIVWEKQKRSLLDYRVGLGKNKIKTEYIYKN